MSYILDALRRADAEREREAGGVPTLQSQARPTFPDDDDVPSVSARPAWLLPAAGGALLALVAAWLLLRGGSDTPAVAPAPVAAAPQPPVTNPAPPQAQAQPAAPSSRVASSPPAQKQVPDRQTPTAAAVSPVRPPTVAVQRPATPPTQMPPRDDRATAAVRGPDTGRPAAAAPVPERIPRLSELPDAQRRGLPALAIGGSVHSPDPSARMVILNGQVQREGDTVGDGLVLKRIRASSAVFEYRGQIFEMPY